MMLYIYIYISYTLSWKITRGITLAKQGKINKREKESSKEEITTQENYKGKSHYDIFIPGPNNQDRLGQDGGCVREVSRKIMELIDYLTSLSIYY